MDNTAEKLESWFEKWFPESTPTGHPIQYLSAEWHHVRQAFDELKEMISDEDLNADAEPEQK